MTTLLTALKTTSPLAEELAYFARSARPPRIRSIARFAEDEIVLPDGPFENLRFRMYRQPYFAHWFAALDLAFQTNCWQIRNLLGPTQSGKTLAGFVVPALYMLFELKETVVLGVPQQDMAADKWQEDLLPAIEKSRYRELLPRRGGGSKGGKVDSIQFAHGPTLRFMGAGGNDKARAAFTTRNVIITETDGFADPSSTSVESTPLKQIYGRTRAYGERRRIFQECTVSLDTGITWQTHLAGTNSRLAIRCPHCRQFVTPEREHLIGWQDAETLQQAKDAAAFICPDCAAVWSDEDRVIANNESHLLHRGQTIAPGSDDPSSSDQPRIVGEPPITDTLSFRWSAVNNLFATASQLAGDEWKAHREVDEDLAEKEMLQFVWALPYTPPNLEATPLTIDDITRRVTKHPRNQIPAWADVVTVGADLGKWLGHYVVQAWSKTDGTSHLVDYGVFEVPSDHFAVEQATVIALNNLSETLAAGYLAQDTGTPRLADQVFVDSGYQASSVYAFIHRINAGAPLARHRYRPVKGQGATQYHRPPRVGKVVKWIGDQLHLSMQATARVALVELNADHWKSRIHERLAAPLLNPDAEPTAGRMTLFAATKHEHLALAKHLVNERMVEDYDQKKGIIRRWERVGSKPNHWFDAAAYAAAAASMLGVPVVPGIAVAKPQPTPQTSPPRNPTRDLIDAGHRSTIHAGGLTTPDGRPFLVTDRNDRN